MIGPELNRDRFFLAECNASSMSLFERLLVPGSTELPECRCGHAMQLARTEELGEQTDAQIRVYNCAYCHHEMRLTVWADT